MEPERDLPEGWKLIRPPGETYAMIESGDYIWTGGQAGVYKIDRGKFELIEHLSLPREVDYVKALYMDREGALWIGHFNGLTVLKEDGNLILEVNEGLPDKRVNCMYEDSQGRLLVGTWGGVAIFNGQSWEAITRENGLMEDMVNVIMEDSLGGYWFGHYVAPRGGISYLRNGKWQYFSVEKGLPHNNITAFHEDTLGYVWAGMGLFERGGAVRFTYNGNEWEIAAALHKEQGLAGEKVRFIFQDHRDVYWFTSEFDGVAVFTKEALLGGGESHILTEERGLANYEVKVILQDADGVLWLGTHYGVNAIEKDALSRLP
ncbi:ligand-binding sensor domain-containing protein [Desulfitibacter alkalitolerans]|uniref:ligand-binding sensor domain-containing protein n=1 Tax=Desulfitibacter alkalitolerans TaxID=264641 RepID=UPI00068812F9|nr:two-component regulator propeller domain-containing protein [Desulfitibacter alkalitolerans]